MKRYKYIFIQNEVREVLVRLMFCDMLGYGIKFAHIYAVKLAQQGGLLHKRSGNKIIILLVTMVIWYICYNRI